MQLKREVIAELQKDRERLDWLEKVGFETGQVGSGKREAGVHCWRVAERTPWNWTARWISSEFTNARAAIDAAMKQKGESGN